MTNHECDPQQEKPRLADLSRERPRASGLAFLSREHRVRNQEQGAHASVLRRFWRCTKRLFWKILLRLPILSAKINFQVEKRGQVLKKNALMAQELRGVRTLAALPCTLQVVSRSQRASWGPRERSSASSPGAQWPRPQEPPTEPQRWGGALSRRAGSCFQDLKPRDSKASDSAYQERTCSLVFSKCRDKDFNFALCQEFHGASFQCRILLDESHRNQAEKAAIITLTFGVKILIKTN